MCHALYRVICRSSDTHMLRHEHDQWNLGRGASQCTALARAAVGVTVVRKYIVLLKEMKDDVSRCEDIVLDDVCVCVLITPRLCRLYLSAAYNYLHHQTAEQKTSTAEGDIYIFF